MFQIDVMNLEDEFYGTIWRWHDKDGDKYNILINVLEGNEGEIKKNCSVINSK